MQPCIISQAKIVSLKKLLGVKGQAKYNLHNTEFNTTNGAELLQTKKN